MAGGDGNGKLALMRASSPRLVQYSLLTEVLPSLQEAWATEQSLIRQVSGPAIGYLLYEPSGGSTMLETVCTILIVVCSPVLTPFYHVPDVGFLYLSTPRLTWTPILG